MSSTIPAAINALTVMFAAAGVAVFDGVIPTNPPDEYVGVAIADPDNPSVEGTQDWAALGNRRKAEDYAVRCEASSWSGDGTMAARRARTFALLAACEAAVVADPSLQGALVSGDAWIGTVSMIAWDSPKGPVATLNFSVHCTRTRI